MKRAVNGFSCPTNARRYSHPAHDSTITCAARICSGGRSALLRGTDWKIHTDGLARGYSRSGFPGTGSRGYQERRGYRDVRRLRDDPESAVLRQFPACLRFCDHEPERCSSSTARLALQRHLSGCHSSGRSTSGTAFPGRIPGVPVQSPPLLPPAYRSGPPRLFRPSIPLQPRIQYGIGFHRCSRCPGDEVLDSLVDLGRTEPYTYVLSRFFGVGVPPTFLLYEQRNRLGSGAAARPTSCRKPRI